MSATDTSVRPASVRLLAATAFSLRAASAFSLRGASAFSMRGATAFSLRVGAACALVALSSLAPAARAKGEARGARHLGPPSPAEVRRVVTLAPSLSELVLALGAGERLVGVTRFDDDPRVAALPRIGGYNDPEPEAVLRLKPDLVLVETAPENRGPVETLARLGIPIDAFPLGTVALIEQALVSVGERLGLAARGRQLRDAIERHRLQVRAQAAAGPHPRALLVFGLEPLVVAGTGSFASELLADAGGINATADQRPFSLLSAEVAVQTRPEVLILCGVEPNPGRAPVPGLAQVRVERLRSTALMHPGPRLPEALDDLVAALRGASPQPASAQSPDSRQPTADSPNPAPAAPSTPADGGAK